MITAACALLSAGQPAAAQAWGADLYVGGTRYQALAERVAATNLVANVRYQAAGGSMGYLSLAGPLDGGTVWWSAAGASGLLRTRARRGLGLGLDVGAHGYAYRDSEISTSGGGAVLHALPLLRASRNQLALEVRGGRHEHVFTETGVSGRRGLYELGVRGILASGSSRGQADFRWLRGEEETFPYVSVEGATSRGAARVWGWAGKWMASDQDGVEWGVGGGLTLGRVGEVWLSVLQEGVDPLVQSPERRAWNVGFSRTLGRARSRTTELAPSITSGRARIRLPEDVVGGGAPSVAGEFSGWRSEPMRREGSEWVLDLPLAPGVYRFAFVRDTGEWFVPDGYPGRLDDGMGGSVAVMVVP